MSSPRPPAPPGRPLSGEAGPALLAAARRLVIAHGYDAVSVADIAQAAGTGRQTLYRRWSSKAELVLDAFTDDAVTRVDAADSRALAPGAAAPGAAAPGAGVRDFLRRTFRALDETGPALRGLMAHAQHEPAFQTLFAERFIRPRRAALLAVLQTARSAGDLPRDLDLDTAVSVLYGALWYRLLLGEPLDDAYAAALTRLISA